MANFTKKDLIREVENAVGLTPSDAELIVQATLDAVVEGIRSGEAIEVRGFGCFRTRQRRGRLARNPKTGEKVEVPAKKIVFFAPSKDLAEMILGDLT